MTRKPFVVANWKMNGSLKANDEWLCAAMPQMSGTRLNCDVAVCAPFVYIPQLVIGFEHSAIAMSRFAPPLFIFPNW